MEILLEKRTISLKDDSFMLVLDYMKRGKS